MSVTVICPTCTRADAYASALCVLGPEGAKKHGGWSVDGDVSALFVLQAPEGVKTETLLGFERYYE
jgi:thiamine biosynthesis lipoprotein ApbE